MKPPTLHKVEHRLVELKAKVEDLNLLRKKLTHMKAQHIGTFQQTDIYYEVPKGRLKLREVQGHNQAELIYYERENITGPKKSDVLILKVPKPAFFKALLAKALKARATIEKTREIYRYRGTKIHLDRVEGLGSFVEFERETTAEPELMKKNEQKLKALMEKLGISPESLMKFSYGDLIQSVKQ